MAGPGGFRPKGPQRPDPAAAAPEKRSWAALMRLVYDELYEGLAPAERPTVTALGRAAHLSTSYVSESFSGKRRPELTAFLSMVTVLRGDPREWEPRWHRAAAQQEPAADVEPPPLPLPGVEEETPETGGTEEPLSSPGTELRRYPLRRFVRATLAWVAAVFAWPVRARRDKAAVRMRRRLVKQVMNRAAADFGRAETHHYLEPRFVILAEPGEDDSGSRRRGRRQRRAEPVPVPTSVSSVRALYGAMDELVVLGRPGMGKTTQLARLAHRLAEEALAGEDESEPPYIPVYLRLDGYRGEPIEEWLAAEMNNAFRGVSAVLVRSWLDEHLLLPVLDGLDEVPEADRPTCVRELLRLRELCPGMAVGCRTDEGDLRRLARSLCALRYVEIQPPTRQDVQAFLNADKAALADVHAALEEDPDLWPLLQSPMMLNVIRITYGNRSADDLRLRGSLADRRSRIFDSYIRECLRRGRPLPDTAPERTLAWLTWLARTLTERGEHVLYLDRLDLSWLSRRERTLPRVVPTVAMASFGLGVPVLWVAVADRAGVLHTSVSSAAVVALAMVCNTAAQAYRSEEHFLRTPEGGGRADRRERGALLVPMRDNGPTMLVILFLLLLTGVDLVTPGTIVVGLAYLWVMATQIEGTLTDVFSPVEQMRWTWRRRERAISPGRFDVQRFALSVCVWIAVESLVGYVVHLLSPDPEWIAPVAALMLGLVYIVGNQFEPSLQDRRPRPNEGIRRTVRFSLVHGFAGLVVAAVCLTTLIGLASPDRDLRAAAFVAALLGMLFAVVRAFRYGGLAVVRHWTIRAVLAHRGRTPFRYRRFLHTAEQRILLFRTDSGYFFPHRLIQLHMDTTAEALLPRVVSRAGATSGPAPEA
ncbi:NACHT domain-containing protein [Streptomyces vilmorinianum]|uniref:NACHT domain-containing protein n=1 Tax=Streptomyces vilmorinianum TaxID=3051092 RepID=UPI0010FB252E|nr:NACHT domain-containing protein [Streptomyces vilmorinianum]